MRDALISRDGLKLDQLPSGARIGTSSLRRQAQLRHYRGDLEMVDMRGNVDTRLAKLARGDYDAIVLAKAGLDRLGKADQISEILPPEICLPAAGQGAIGIETRKRGGRDFCRGAKVESSPIASGRRSGARRCWRDSKAAVRFRSARGARMESGNLTIDACVLLPRRNRIHPREPHRFMRKCYGTGARGGRGAARARRGPSAAARGARR